MSDISEMQEELKASYREVIRLRQENKRLREALEKDRVYASSVAVDAITEIERLEEENKRLREAHCTL